jgi:CheY-like chemotaxis protein
MAMENRRILLVEDDPDDAELIVTGLRRSNLVNDIDVARDGVEALDYLYRRGAFAGRTTPDPLLVLLDLKMPRLDGREVLQQIKSDPRLRSLPVVVLTSSANERDVASGYALGANAYVVKPVHFGDLVEAVSQIGLFWIVVNRTPA